MPAVSSAATTLLSGAGPARQVPSNGAAGSAGVLVAGAVAAAAVAVGSEARG
jgi:hypothetical protein